MEIDLSSVSSKFMSIDEINEKVLSHYSFKVYDIENIKFKDTEKQRAVFKINTDRGTKCLKKVYYDESKLLFIYSVIEWLNAKGIKCPRLISTKKGLKYVKYNNSLFILTDWIDGRKCNYDNINDVIEAAKNLAKIHSSSLGFKPINRSLTEYSPVDFFQSYNKHFLQLLEMSNKAFLVKDRFSKILIDNIDYNIEKAKESTYLLSKIDYTTPLGDEVSNRSICHLDYVNKNLIFTENEQIFVIDFDNSQIDFAVHDISSFLKRILKRENTSWDFDIFKKSIEGYETVRKLSYNEHIVIASVLAFPYKFWKVSRDYYKNLKNCNRDSFVTIIKKIVKHQDEHDEFCKNITQYIEQKFKE